MSLLLPPLVTSAILQTMTKTTAIAKSTCPSRCASTAKAIHIPMPARMATLVSDKVAHSMKRKCCQLQICRPIQWRRTLKICSCTAARVRSKVYSISSTQVRRRLLTSITFFGAVLWAILRIHITSRCCMIVHGLACSPTRITQLVDRQIRASMLPLACKDVSTPSKLFHVVNIVQLTIFAEDSSNAQQGTTYSFQAAGITPGLVVECNTQTNTCTTIHR